MFKTTNNPFKTPVQTLLPKSFQTIGDYLPIARFGKIHGLKGDIRLYPFSDEPSTLFERYTSFFLIHPDKTFTPIELQNPQWVQRSKLAYFLVQSKGFSLEALGSLTHQLLYIVQSDLPTLETGYYQHQLIGMEIWLDCDQAVFDSPCESGKILLGKLSHFIEQTHYSIMCVDPTPESLDKQRRFIPFDLEHHICAVDQENRKIIVNWFIQ